MLYHGESEWCDPQAMAFERPLRPLYDQQIHCHVVPADVFAEPERYHTQLGNPLVINGAAVPGLCGAGGQEASRRGGSWAGSFSPGGGCRCSSLGRCPWACARAGLPPPPWKPAPFWSPPLCPALCGKLGWQRRRRPPACDRLRLLVVEGESPCVVLSNEGTEPYVGTVSFPGLEGPCFWYDPWHNRCQRALSETTAAGLEVQVEVEPLQLRVLALGQAPAELHTPWEKGQELALRGVETLPVRGGGVPRLWPGCAGGAPRPAGPGAAGVLRVARYETAFQLEKAGPLVLELSDAAEGVEVFLNGRARACKSPRPSGMSCGARLGKTCWPLRWPPRWSATATPSRRGARTGSPAAAAA